MYVHLHTFPCSCVCVIVIVLHTYVHICVFKFYCNTCFNCVRFQYTYVCMWINTYVHSRNIVPMLLLYFTAFPTAEWETAGSTTTDARTRFSVVIPCNPPSTAVPTPTVVWESRLTTPGDSPYATITTAPLTNVDPSMRFQLTPEGDLIIHKLVSADFDRTYRCSVTNANVYRTVASGRTHTLNAGMYVMFMRFACRVCRAPAVCITFNVRTFKYIPKYINCHAHIHM